MQINLDAKRSGRQRDQPVMNETIKSSLRMENNNKSISPSSLVVKNGDPYSSAMNPLSIKASLNSRRRGEKLYQSVDFSARKSNRSSVPKDLAAVMDNSDMNFKKKKVFASKAEAEEKSKGAKSPSKSYQIDVNKMRNTI